MAEVDGIILDALRRLGCDLGDEITSIRQFTVDILVAAVAACIRVISPETPVPSRLSSSMATKYRQASVIADACKTAGYTGELGYEAFLYGGESDMRRLLAFLVDKIPKEEQVGSVTSSGDSFASEIRNVIKSEMERPWLPVSCYQWQASRSRTVNMVPSVFRSQRLSVPVTKDDARQAKIFTDQAPSALDLAVSIVEYNSLKLVCAGQQYAPTNDDPSGHHNRMTNFRKNLSASLQGSLRNDGDPSRTGEISSNKPVPRGKPALPPRRKQKEPESFQTSSASDAEVQQSEDDRIASLKNQLSEATENFQAISDEWKILRDTVSKAETAIRDGKAFLDSFEQSVTIRKQVSLASVDGNINGESLQTEIESLQQTLEGFQNQWTVKQNALLAELTQLRLESRSQENSTERLKENITETKQASSQLRAELSDRDDYVELLRKEQQKVSQSTGRASYTKRILEILANIKKQRLDIDKIIKDTRIIQKDINHLSGRLDRAFTETDELMFRDAKGDEFVRKAYKNVATFHESCSALIQAVEATGAIMREMKDLEDDVDNETKKDKEQNIERIQNDLKAVRADNLMLTAKIAPARNSSH